MARRYEEDDEEEFEEYEDEFEEYDEYEEEYEGKSFFDRFVDSSWRRAIVVPLILVLFAFGTWYVWKKYQNEVLNHPSYALDPSTIQYTDPPDWWLKSDVLNDVVKLGSLEKKKVHETGLTVQIANAFEHHPWVKRVERVRVSYPAKLSVELTYREPVAMVAMPDEDPTDEIAWLQPIDAEGVLLVADDFTPEYAQEFPRIDVGNTRPSGPVGTGWGDDAVADAAKIAEVLYSEWDTLKKVIYQIELSTQAFSMSNSLDFDIRGFPDGGPDPPGLVIRWGRAPGKEQHQEPLAKAKLEKLKQWVEEMQVRDQLPIGEIDLRSVGAFQASRQETLHR